MTWLHIVDIPGVVETLGFIKCAHIHQLRKYTDEPYANHCYMVGYTVFQYLRDMEDKKLLSDMVKAGLLHDVIEDTSITKLQLESVFGTRVASLVQEVTDVAKKEDGNRKERHIINLKHLSECSKEAASIKCADIISNVTDIVKLDENFAETYVPEKFEQLALIKHADPVIWEAAHNAVLKALKDLDDLI